MWRAWSTEVNGVRAGRTAAQRVGVVWLRLQQVDGNHKPLSRKGQRQLDAYPGTHHVLVKEPPGAE